MRARPRPCVVCGRRVDSGESRCEQHKVGGARPRPCMVCGVASQGNYCLLHEPQVDEAERNARNPYRKAYSDPEYARNRRIRFERAGGRCEMCGIGLQPAEWDCDHLVDVKNGGTNSLDNLRVLCRPCHKRKTAATRRRT